MQSIGHIDTNTHSAFVPSHCTPLAFVEHPLPPPLEHRAPGVLHGTPLTYIEHPLPHPPQHWTTDILQGTPPATPAPSPTALHTRCTTRYRTSLYGTPPPTLPYSTEHQVAHCCTSFSGSPPLPHSTPGVPHCTTPAFLEFPPPPQQHCTPGAVDGTPPAFTEHPPHPQQHWRPGVLHGTPPAFMEHPVPPHP